MAFLYARFGSGVLYAGALILALVFFPLFFVPVAHSQEQVASLLEMDIEDLLNIEVVTVSKKPEKLTAVSSAIYVITQEDIRRSGATAIPEALRMVPGLQVARINASQWAITARGFNGRFANKLLVMVDGRSIYTPLTSGVDWDRQDIMLENVERIEVIRGPGGSIWGANAMNGIINIITKNAKDTEGALITAGAGTEETGFTRASFGGKFGESTFYRVFTKYSERDGLVDSDGTDLDDQWESSRGGFRIDSSPTQTDSFSFQGEIYADDFTNETLTRSGRESEESEHNGSNIMGVWDHQFSDTSAMTLQVYYDRTERMEPSSAEYIDTYDLDLHHNSTPFAGNELTWGAGYRLVQFTNEVAPPLFYDQPNRDDNLYSFFAQDKITLVPDELFWTIGSKYEHNEFTGSEFQPSTRIVWTPDARNTVWAALSRAILTPSRADNDLSLDLGGVVLLSSPDLQSEEVITYEAGYRVRPTHNFFLDIAIFYNEYSKLASREFIFEGEKIIVFEDNKLSGESYGLEISGEYDITDSWKFLFGYTLLSMNINTALDSTDDEAEGLFENNYPKSQFNVRTYLDLPYKLEFDAVLYYVEGFHFIDELNIDSYTRVDFRLGWMPAGSFAVSVVGQNLLDSRHGEYELSRAIVQEVERSVYLKITWKQ